MNLPANIELTPHTLRRGFATYHAETGLPLPLLQRLLGHSSIRTTALYWQNIYGDDGPSDILVGKKWLERHKPSQNREKEPSKSPITENFPQSPKNPDSDIIKNEPIITTEKLVQQDNSLLTNKTPQGKFSLNTTSGKKEISKQLPAIANKIKQPTDQEEKIKRLEQQLAQVQAENNHLKLENKHLKALIRKDQETEAKIIQLLPFKPNK